MRPAHGSAAAAKTSGTVPKVEPLKRLYDPSRKVKVVSYNMERFAQDCVTAFCELSGYAPTKGGAAPTPFLDEANDPLIVLEDDSAAGQVDEHPQTTPPQGGSTSTPPQGGSKKKKSSGVSSPEGTLSKIACKVLMKIMYLARFARPDLLRAVGALSTLITKWTTLCDRKLFRIIKY